MAKKNFVGTKGARLLRKVEKHILAEPKRYEQNTIIKHGLPGERTPFGSSYPACGTVACIGGWITVFNNEKATSDDISFDSIARQLGVNDLAVARLCDYQNRSASYWPKKYISAYGAAKTPRGKARVAVRRIEHFIKTGE